MQHQEQWRGGDKNEIGKARHIYYDFPRGGKINLTDNKMQNMEIFFVKLFKWNVKVEKIWFKINSFPIFCNFSFNLTPTDKELP